MTATALPGSSWVVGRGGLLGSAVERRLIALDARVWQPRGAVAWRDPARATADLQTQWASFRESAGDGPTTIYWCAGAGVTASTADELRSEVTVLQSLLDRIGVDSAVSLFISSSAGGLYAGAHGAPFDEFAEPAPLAPYGIARLAMEQAAARWARRGGRLLIGRIANLYGPGQDITKPQGLVTQLLRAHLTRDPLQVYVPLDTVRDYLYVDDAARLIVSGSHRLTQQPAAAVVTKVVASQRAMTIGDVIGELRQVLRRRPQIVLGASPVGKFQARDLRLVSRVWADLDAAPLTPFPVGVHATLIDLARTLGSGQLSAG